VPVNRRLILFVFLLAGVAAAALIFWLCFPAPGPLRLTRTGFSRLPGWNETDAGPAFTAFVKSCAEIAGRPDNTPMGGVGYAGVAKDWREACRAARTGSPSDKKVFFEQWFTPVIVSAGRVRDGLFTGYYEPEIAVSRTRHGAYQTPVYGVPSDLVQADLGDFRTSLRGEHIAGKVANGRLVPFASRAEIDANGITTAAVLFYAADPVALFFLHIQGSGRALFDDGRAARIAYAAQNGQVYTAIGKVLVARGALSRDRLSMAAIRDWLKSHPREGRAVMEADASYVFFKEEPLDDPALGAKGAEGVPLTAGASLAVDAKYHALGVPFFVATDGGGGEPPLQNLFVSQDRGGAIRGAVRADVYFGAGAKAEARAGAMKQSGRFFVLLPKPLAARLAERTDFPDAAP
jgi:membrane-bound lytic murein transglycosylase A